MTKFLPNGGEPTPQNQNTERKNHMSYNPLSDDHKIRDAIVSVFQKLRDELGAGVTLQMVTQKFNDTFGLNYSQAEVGKYLSSELKSRRQQGVSSTTTNAGIASDNAAAASAEANETGSDTTKHATAAVLHEDASRAHKAAARFHDRSAEWHNARAEGANPEPLEAD
jgi:hypothetical protein